MTAARKEPSADTYSGRFAIRLRKVREKAGLTVQELSEKTEIPVKTLYDWESGKPTFRLDVLPVLSKALGVKIRTLMPEE